MFIKKTLKLEFVDIAIFLLAGVVLLLALFNFHLPMHIGKSQVTADAITVNFSRSIGQDDIVKKSITITPSIGYTVKTTDKVLTVQFSEKLKSDTTYKLVIDQAFTDNYGIPLSKPYEIEWRTKPLQFSYISTSPTSKEQKIIVQNLSTTESTELFNGENIIEYEITNKFVIVNTESHENTNQLTIINRDSQRQTVINHFPSRIFSITLNPNGNEVAYLEQPLELQYGYFYPSGITKIKTVNLTDFTVTELTAKETEVGVIELMYTPDGKSLLFRNSTEFSYVVPLNKRDEIKLVNKDILLGSFDEKGTIMSYSKYNTGKNDDYFSTYVLEMSGNSIEVFNGKTNTGKVSLFPKSKKLVAEIHSTKTKIIVADFNGNTLVTVQDNNKYFLSPQISFDEQLIMYESLNESEYQKKTYDQPYDSQLTFYTLSENKTTTSIPHAREGKWVK